MQLSSLTPRNLANAARTVAMVPFALLLRLTKPSVWIITERPDQARDNGYCFYRYLRTQHPDLPVYYVIDKDAEDREKLEPYGNLIDFDSWRHYFYFCLSRIHISAHVGGCNPSSNSVVKRLKGIMGYKDVFLPHGVSYGVSEFCLAKYAKIDLFICSGRPEYQNVLANYGYEPDQVVYTGFPRLDAWHYIDVNPRQIVLMPTWRLYLAQDPAVVFEETTYYRAYQSLLNSAELAEILAQNDLKLLFYLHNDMRKYAGLFSTECPSIEIVRDDDAYDIQELLKESALLITDYSSVHFDFAYMGKPVLYYQFDKDEFWSKQYEQSTFDAATDGFGPVAYSLDDLVRNLEASYDEGFELKGEYLRRMRVFYELHDEHNCDRVYEEIVKRWPAKK